MVRTSITKALVITTSTLIATSRAAPAIVPRQDTCYFVNANISVDAGGVVTLNQCLCVLVSEPEPFF